MTESGKHFPLVIPLEGQKFGKLTVVSRSGSRRHLAMWLCNCECGGTAIVSGRNIRTGVTKSCGCQKKEHFNTVRSRKGNKKHGDYGSAEYRIWRAMLSRCENPNVRGFSDYGGRGITVCQEWHDYATFLADMGRRPSKGMSIDRKENDKGYFRDNCRWATAFEQARNSRKNHLVTANGKTLCLSEWSEIIGIRAATIRHRLRLGWSDEKAINQPLRGTK